MRIATEVVALLPRIFRHLKQNFEFILFYRDIFLGFSDFIFNFLINFINLRIIIIAMTETRPAGVTLTMSNFNKSSSSGILKFIN